MHSCLAKIFYPITADKDFKAVMILAEDVGQQYEGYTTSLQDKMDISLRNVLHEAKCCCVILLLGVYVHLTGLCENPAWIFCNIAKGLDVDLRAETSTKAKS